jgi:hypothetical protein
MSSKSFLPDDYVEERLDLRANIMSGVLFVIVMLGVIGAFFVTNQKWQTIRTAQAEVAQKYEEAGRQIYELTELEEQKKSMLSKAEMASSLVERVPRSILLAEVINRMPDQLSILEFDLTSEKVRQISTDPSTGQNRPTRGKTRSDVAKELDQQPAPKFRVKLQITGLAVTDLEVSQFIHALKNFELLETVSLEYSEGKEIMDEEYREFRIHVTLNETADISNITPLQIPRGPGGQVARVIVPEKNSAVTSHTFAHEQLRNQ